MPQPRRKFIVDGFQTHFVLTQMAWLSICFALFVAVLTGPLVWQLNGDSDGATDLSRATTLLQLNDRIWIPLLALFFGVTWTLVKHSHRVAGPLFRFRRVFTQIAAGDLRGRVRVREHDYIVQEAEALDRMMSALHDRVRKSQEAAAEVRTALAELSRTTGPIPPHRIAALLARAEETESTLAEFVTGPATPEAETAAVEVQTRVVPKLQLSFAQKLGAALLLLGTAIAMAVPAYTSALGHAREIRANRQHDRSEVTPAATPGADLHQRIR